MIYNSKISIIVPVYNVKDFLNKCVESILTQTYQNLEIILVDDGSTDGSGAICDAYAAEDARIQVIHKENGGLSSTRNAGLRKASGEYISFVDGDDFIDVGTCQELLERCVENDLSLIVARLVESVDGEDKEVTTTENFQIFDKEQMLHYLLFEDKNVLVTPSVCARLFRREVLAGLHFFVGRNYEDILFSTEVFLKSELCGYYDKVVYHYVMRGSSIMHQGIENKDALGDDFFGSLIPQIKEQQRILEEAGEFEFAKKARNNLYHSLFHKYYVLRNGASKRKARAQIVREARKDKRWNLRYMKEHDTKKAYCVALCFYICPDILRLFWKMRGI